MFRRSGVVVVSLGLLFGFAALLSAAELHVPADYGTIQEAVDVAARGDTIIVAAGEYAGVCIGDKTDLVLRGEPGAVIRGRILINNCKKETVEKCKNLTIEGFQIVSEEEGILVMGMIDGLTIKYNEIVACAQSGIVFASTCIYRNVLILDNKIANNGYDGIQLLGRTEEVEEGMPVTIEGNSITNNGRSSSTGVGIRIGEDNSVLLTGNIIVGNPFAGIHPS